MGELEAYTINTISILKWMIKSITKYEIETFVIAQTIQQGKIDFVVTYQQRRWTNSDDRQIWEEKVGTRFCGEESIESNFFKLKCFLN